jgi:hypothetical protein
MSIILRLFPFKYADSLYRFLAKRAFSLPFLKFVQKTIQKNDIFGQANKNEFFVKSRLTPLRHINIICSVRSMGIGTKNAKKRSRKARS